MFLLQVCFFALIGCGVRAPQVHYLESSVTQSTPEAVAMEIEFEVSNNNDEPLQLTLFDYTVSVDGNIVYRGKHSAQQTVPTATAVTSKIPAVIQRNQILGLQNATWRLSGLLGYIPPKEFTKTLLKSGIWKPTTQVHAHGSFQIPSFD